MTDHNQQPSFEPFIENRRSFILLRWLLVILCSYLVLFGRVREEPLSFQVLSVVGGFFLSNIVLALLPPAGLAFAQARHLVIAMDAVFISLSLYHLRVDGPQIHVAFIAVFLVAIIWADLRLIMFSLLASSILFGAFSVFGILGFGTEVPAAMIVTPTT